MKDKKDVNLRDLQLVELDMLKEFIEICKKLNLRYFLAGGTLLGCIRHSGFIPWDDDLDVMMPREDYEIFLEKGQELLQENYFLQTYKTDPEYTMGFAKIRNSNTTFIENTVKDSNINHGVFIDIFPLDGCRSNKEIKNFINKKLYSLYNIQISKNYSDLNKTTSLKSKIAQSISNLMYGKKTINEMLRKKEKIAKKYSYDESKYACIFVDPVGKPLSNIFPRSYFDKGIVKKFEDIDAIVPKDYDGFLKQQYGDYMQLPPEDKRQPHHYNQVIDLKKSYKCYMDFNK